MMKNKYKNTKIVFDGIQFASKREARRYIELSALQQAGKILNLELQKKFVLIPSQYAVVNGKRKCVERECSYISDFVYYKDGQQIVEDTKGYRTPEYKIKRKLMLKVHGIRIKEV